MLQSWMFSYSMQLALSRVLFRNIGGCYWVGSGVGGNTLWGGETLIPPYSMVELKSVIDRKSR